MPLRACVVDSLGLGITCVLYHSIMCTRHPDLVSFAFYIPEFLLYLYEHVHVQVYIHVVVAVHSQDSMKLACVNAVLGTATIPLEVPKQKTCMNCMQ